MRADYRPAITDKFLQTLRDEVFGPCTTIGECYGIPELRESVECKGMFVIGPGESRGMRFKQWFEMQLQVERIQAERDGIRGADIKRMERGIRERMEELICNGIE
jgi:hypothetical protein